ncbi:integral membrane sensor signal transduction histidine kinase [Paenibacillus curdlanolyticus YK9]|uniref:Integral membrane sensor signal transduction histidine kinase n=1 Tax=Paenibacillus curdlanolyticus YK9 TaxID=717606 RepID=E0IAQ9_9BACL|nr:sensor histidine kinase [Paenibacillus curdlanolyticus]EFM10463.1 integral membrane sensor signal transduction histidine kinase [Paenibacillus curdlanolyticus YK9]
MIIKRPLIKPTIRTKLVLAALVCMLVPMLITMTSSELLTKDMLRKNAEENARQSLRIVNESVRTIFSNMMYVANFIQFDSELNTLLREELQDDKKTQAYDRYLRQIRLMRTLETLSFSGEKLYISILLPNGKAYSNYPVSSDKLIAMQSEPWFRDVRSALTTTRAWVGVHENSMDSRSKSRYLITTVRALKLTTSSPSAYVVVSMEESRLHKVWEQKAADQQIILTDREGRVVSHLDVSQIGKPSKAYDGQADPSATSLVRIDRQDYLVTRMDMSFYNWSLTSLMPYKETIGKFTDISRNMLLVLIFFFSFFLVVLILLIRQVTKPIHYLSSIVRKINEGNLEIRSNVRGVDEIGALGRAIDHMLDRIKDMIQKIKLEQQLKRKAEIAMLQAQINPHFLFNILNSIRMRVLLKGDDENADIIESLSTVLRMTIDRNNAFVTLREEVEVVRHYLELLNFRRSQPIHLLIELAQETLLWEIPRLIIQPLIENACQHGIKQNSGTITIVSRIVEDQLIIVVSDDGEGMDQETLDALKRRLDGIVPNVRKNGNKLNGIGLTNVAERVRIIYGDRSGIEVKSRVGAGTEITITIANLAEEAMDDV